MLHSKKDKIKRMVKDNPCLCFNVRKASRIITQTYDEALRSIGYTPSQIMILSSIQELHRANINEIADAVSTDRTTVSRNLLLLKRDGLTKPCDCHDRREKAIMLTDKGFQLLQKAEALWQKKHQAIEKIIGAKRMEGFIKELNEVLQLVQKQ